MRASRGGGGDPPGDVAGRRVVALASVCVAVPSLVAAVQAIRWGWVPASDQATIATRAVDVLTTRTPRLGQLSGASVEVGLETRSPGPMGYWPFALTARWGPLWGSAVVAAALSGSAMVASVRLAARRGGPALALALAAGLVLSARALNPANLASTWNPAVGIMPLVLLVLLSWSVADGEVHLLPVAVLVGSFCAQVHAALAVAALPVLAIGVIAGLAPPALHVIAALRARRRWRPGRTAGAVLVAAGVAAGCWALPLVDQLTGDPGNLTRLSRASPGEPVVWRGVGRSVVHAVGAVPAFLGGDRAPRSYAADVLLHRAPVVGVVGAVLVVAGLVGLAVHGLWRRRRELAVPPLLALALLLAAVTVVRGTAGSQFLVLTYVLWWTVPVGMLAWLVVVRGIGQATGAGRAVARHLEGRRGAFVAGAVGIALLAVAVASPVRSEPEEPIHAEARAVGDAVVAHLRPGGTVLVAGAGTAGSQLVASTAYRIRRAGGRPVVEGNDGVAAGPRSVPRGRRCDAVVTLSPQVPAGATVVATVRLPQGHGPAPDVLVGIGTDDGPPSC
jgi:hypothetical protein